MLPGDIPSNIKVLDPNNRDGNGEEAQRKDTNEHQLLRPLQIEVLDNRHGQQENRNIRDNVPRSVDVNVGRVGHAICLDALVPKPLNRATDEQGDEHLRKGPRTDNDDGDDVDDAHTLDGEDAVVLQEKGHFSAEETRAVEEEGDPEAFPVSRDEGGGLDGPDVSAEAVLGCCSENTRG